VAADVGNQFDAALRVARQRAALGLLRQGEVVTRVGHGELVPDVARTGLEDEPLFALEQRLVEIGSDGKLTCRLL